MGQLPSPVIEVVTDYAAHAVWARRGADAYCAPAGGACADLVRHGVDPSRIFATGIPVRDGFVRARGDSAPGAHGGPLRVLITSGGFGVGPIRRVVQSFVGAPDVELTVVCGNNPRCEREVREACAAFARPPVVVGFEPDMPSRLRAADVVVSKPGGLTVSECATAARPMLFVGGVPGQETHNQRWAVAAGAGLVCRPEEVANVVTTLDLHRDRLRRMSQRAASLVGGNAADAVIDVVLSASSGNLRRADMAAPRAVSCAHALPM